MKLRWLVGIAAAGLLLVGGYQLSQQRKITTDRPLASNPSKSPPTSTITEPAEIFQKAFWKRPSPTDKIPHAERREWSDSDGLQKWQWFIAVEPSPEFVKYLWEENAFSLSPSLSALTPTAAPNWFSPGPGGIQVMKAPGGNMILFICKRHPKRHLKILAAVFHKRHSSRIYDTYERFSFKDR